MKKLFLPVLTIVWFLLLVIFISHFPIKTKPEINSQNSSLTPTKQLAAIKVKRVVDGDTIELESGEKVRYIGINTPETVDPRRPVQCFGQEAKEENKRLVEGKMVKLEKDISERDKYDRLLRYVYVGSIFVNDYLVRNGFAQVYTFPPDVKYTEQFKEAEEEARINKKGLWQFCPTKDNFFPFRHYLTIPDR